MCFAVSVHSYCIFTECSNRDTLCCLIYLKYLHNKMKYFSVLAAITHQVIEIGGSNFCSSSRGYVQCQILSKSVHRIGVYPPVYDSIHAMLTVLQEKQLSIK
jgi:hypothetical protein